MGLQYNYGQQAADAEYKRNLQMWKDTNFGAQRNEMEKAGLSVGLMYGNGGGSAASTAGGTATTKRAKNQSGGGSTTTTITRITIEANRGSKSTRKRRSNQNHYRSK